MFYCRQILLDSSSKVIGSQYIDLNIVNASGTPPTLLTDAQAICQTYNTAFDAIDGYMTFSGDSALNALFDTYFSFDPVIFEMIIGATIVSFAVGFGTGQVIKLMGSKTLE